MMRILFLLFVLMNSVSTLNAQVAASAKIDRSEVLIGEPVNIELRLSQPRNTHVSWPGETDSIGGLEILSLTPVDTAYTTDSTSLILTQRLAIAVYDSGRYTIPPFVFKYTAGQDKTIKSFETDALQFSAQLVKVDTTQAIRDIRPIREVPYDWTLIAILIFSAIILGWAGYKIYNKYFKYRKVVPVAEKVTEVFIPAHEKALAALKALDDEKQWQNGNVKYYHTALTDILRSYMEDRWNINAMELTSDEILRHGFILLSGEQEKEKLRRILLTADLVKFAKAQPLAAEHTQSMQDAIDFIRLTTSASSVTETVK